MYSYNTNTYGTQNGSLSVQNEVGNDYIMLRFHPLNSCMHTLAHLYTPAYLYRRDRLWIAMEYCGGGSLQDIYHGEFHNYSI